MARPMRRHVAKTATAYGKVPAPYAWISAPPTTTAAAVFSWAVSGTKGTVAPLTPSAGTRPIFPAAQQLIRQVTARGGRGVQRKVTLTPAAIVHVQIKPLHAGQMPLVLRSF